MSRSPAVKEREVRKVEGSGSDARFMPAVDILETPTEFGVVLDMPGVPKDGIDVEYRDRVLTIHGRVSGSASKDRKSLWREYHEGHYLRTFKVREDVDAEKLSAAYEDGVLTVRLPKREPAVPRKISVEIK